MTHNGGEEQVGYGLSWWEKLVIFCKEQECVCPSQYYVRTRSEAFDRLTQVHGYDVACQFALRWPVVIFRVPTQNEILFPCMRSKVDQEIAAREMNVRPLRITGVAALEAREKAGQG